MSLGKTTKRPFNEEDDTEMVKLAPKKRPQGKKKRKSQKEAEIAQLLLMSN